MAGHPDECPLAQVCHGEALPWRSLQGHVAIEVPASTILVVRKGMYATSGRDARAWAMHHIKGMAENYMGSTATGSTGRRRAPPRCAMSLRTSLMTSRTGTYPHHPSALTCYLATSGELPYGRI